MDTVHLVVLFINDLSEELAVTLQLVSFFVQCASTPSGSLTIAPAQYDPLVEDEECHAQQEEAQGGVAGSGHGMGLAHTPITGLDSEAGAVTAADGLWVFG